MKQNDRQDDEEQLKIHDVRGECFAPHLALMLKSEWHKCDSDDKWIDEDRLKAGL